MAKKQPVKVADIEFDALISKEEHYEAEIPDYPTEDGYSVNDSIIIKPFTLNMVLYVTDMPVTYKNKFKGQKNRVKTVCQKLISLYGSKKPFTIITKDGTYSNMSISSMTISKTNEMDYAREIPISFKRIDITNTKTTTIPSSYMKSGETKKNVGTANTSSTSTNSSSTAKTTNSTNTSKSNASILYNAGKSLGFLK